MDWISCRWIDLMLRGRLLYTTIVGETIWTKMALGYADDLVVLTQGIYNIVVTERMLQNLNLITRWTKLERLNI